PVASDSTRPDRASTPPIAGEQRGALAKSKPLIVGVAGIALVVMAFGLMRRPGGGAHRNEAIAENPPTAAHGEPSRTPRSAGAPATFLAPPPTLPTPTLPSPATGAGAAEEPPPAHMRAPAPGAQSKQPAPPQPTAAPVPAPQPATPKKPKKRYTPTEI